ncbi:MAG: efflux RND transporter periplasmic adaptor subunit [Planctomycetes bacterium]|nr:efflux RND transporter periplasmic adaptor subunit [Planctomycetota bacterium]
MARFPRILIPLVALAGVSYALWTANSAPPPQPAPPPVQPPRAPYPTTVGGAAIVEPAAERTSALGAPYAGLVTDVFHSAGERVAKGEHLFRLDDRPLRADRVVLASQLLAVQSKLDRLLALPRPEDIPPTQTRVEAAIATVEDRKSALTRLEHAAAAGRGVIPEDEVDRARWALVVAERNVATAEADLVRAKQPAWAPDIAEARAEVAKAAAALEQNQQNIDRALVRAPFDGTILELNVHPGEYATANRDPLILFGDLSSLRVRVDVDEESAPLVHGRPRAVAVVRGFPEKPVELEFLRVEPWVRPKRSLTGATNERVDTRVLQVIFKLGKSDVPIYVGQQVDVFMEGALREDVLGGTSSSDGVNTNRPDPLRTEETK